jgi:glucose-1-phosphate thymidylyltransferase
MIAILLCAGYGTRQQTLTKHTPNPLLDVAGRQVLDYQMEQFLKLPDLRMIHLVANGRFAAPFYRWWTRWRPEADARGITFCVHNDGSLDAERRLGEVGDLAFVLRIVGRSKGAVVSAGGNIYRFDLRPVWDTFRESDENLVLALPERHHQVLQQHTVIEFGEDGRVEMVHDQPEEPPAHWVCPTLYFLQPAALEEVDGFLRENGDADRLARFLGFLAAKQTVRAVKLPENRLSLHINTRYQFDRANELLKAEV